MSDANEKETLPNIIWIIYTTTYRTGGDKFERSAHTLAELKRRENPDATVICESINSKSLLKIRFAEFLDRKLLIDEWHFVGHSGLYGIMFGSTAWPEQLSPFEWQQLTIPFSDNAKAFFHACRTARWFAPFVAQVFKIDCYGYHWYTSVSLREDKFKWDGMAHASRPLYILSCKGRKSHGLIGSFLKYVGIAKCEPFKKYTPDDFSTDRSYNHVAELYHKVFTDITVRKDEWTWLNSHLPPESSPRVLDIGCGNGTLLKQLSHKIANSVGVDISAEMLKHADQQCVNVDNLAFKKIDGPRLPFADNSFDVVISFLSFRYLDWDPILDEISRVLSPNGKLLIVDMVAAPVTYRDVPKFLVSKIKTTFSRTLNTEYKAHLKNLVTNPQWQDMLKYNPIRAKHEYKNHLESRFPAATLETLNVGFTSQVVAFDSGDFANAKLHHQTYP